MQREIQRWDPPGASRHPPFTRGALRAGEDTAPYKKKHERYMP